MLVYKRPCVRVSVSACACVCVCLCVCTGVANVVQPFLVCDPVAGECCRSRSRPGYGALCNDCDLAKEDMEVIASGIASVKSKECVHVRVSIRVCLKFESNAFGEPVQHSQCVRAAERGLAYWTTLFAVAEILQRFRKTGVAAAAGGHACRQHCMCDTIYDWAWSSGWQKHGVEKGKVPRGAGVCTSRALRFDRVELTLPPAPSLQPGIPPVVMQILRAFFQKFPPHPWLFVAHVPPLGWNATAATSTETAATNPLHVCTPQTPAGPDPHFPPTRPLRPHARHRAASRRAQGRITSSPCPAPFTPTPKGVTPHLHDGQRRGGHRVGEVAARWRHRAHNGHRALALGAAKARDAAGALIERRQACTKVRRVARVGGHLREAARDLAQRLSPARGRVALQGREGGKQAHDGTVAGSAEAGSGDRGDLVAAAGRRPRRTIASAGRGPRRERTECTRCHASHAAPSWRSGSPCRGSTLPA
eukprot:365412-Chlamydomonas_euryale.AAC.9